MQKQTKAGTEGESKKDRPACPYRPTFLRKEGHQSLQVMKNDSTLSYAIGAQDIDWMTSHGINKWDRRN